MIVHNDFREFDNEAREVDKELYYVNMYIYRAPKLSQPMNRCGDIYIPDTDNKDFFAGELSHEAGHSVFDPITLFNYVSALNQVCKELNIDYQEALELGSVITDILDDWQISKNEKLRQYRLSALKEIYRSYFNPSDILALVLWQYYSKIHGEIDQNLKKYFDKDVQKTVNDIIDVLTYVVDRNSRYVEIARILLKFKRKKEEERQKGQGAGQCKGDLPYQGEGEGQGQGEGEGQGQGEGEGEGKGEGEGEGQGQGQGVGAGAGAPILPKDEKDLEQAIEQALKESKNVEDVKRILKMLKAIGKGLGLGLGEMEKMLNDDAELLRAFYQRQADKIRAFISYPKTKTNECIKIGAKKWSPSDGVGAIEAKKTVEKFGVNIPLVTTRTYRILNKFISSKESVKPIDIVISIDTSGSVDTPRGLMKDASDYEVTMVYALIDEAKRKNQRVGLTLWSTNIYHTTLPKTYDWREVDKLKTDILRYWSSAYTHIIYPLRQAKEHSDKLFLVFTDGNVYYDELIEVDNVVFFLIMPSQANYIEFVKRYGAHRVVRIDSIDNIPKVTLEWYRRVMQ